MLIRVGEFKKKDGELRTMRFLKISDMTDEVKNKLGLEENKETKKKTIAENSEMVYDIDVKGFRIFNWATVTAEVTQIEMECEI